MEEKEKKGKTAADLRPEEVKGLIRLAIEMCEMVAFCAPRFAAGSRGEQSVETAREALPRLTQLLCAAVAIGLAATLGAAVPVAWTNTPGMSPRVLPPIPHGSTVDFEVTLGGYTTPPVADGADVRMWFQTNGMGGAWWSAPATISGNVIRSTFGPAQDTGADRVSVFFGAPSNVFASAVLRLSHAPGFAPNVLEIPRAALDFATVEYSHAPWVETEQDPTVPAWAKAENPPQTDISGKADKSELAAAATSATNYTDEATNDLTLSLSSRLSQASQASTNYTDEAIAGLATNKADKIKTVVVTEIEEGDFWIDLYNNRILKLVEGSNPKTWSVGGTNDYPRLEFIESISNYHVYGSAGQVATFPPLGFTGNETVLPSGYMAQFRRVSEITNTVTRVYNVTYDDAVDSATNSVSQSFSSRLFQVSQSSTNYTDSATALTPVFSTWTIYRDGVDVTAQMQALPQWIEGSWSEGVYFEGFWHVYCHTSADDGADWDTVYNPHATIINGHTIDYFGGSHTYTATRQFLGYRLGSQADKMLASTNSLSALSERLAVAAQSSTNYTDSTASSLYPKSQGETLATQVAAIGAVLNGEDARFVVTNYDSVVHTPEAYVEVQVSNNWLRVWREGARWDKFEAENHVFKTNVTAELAHKADRAWGAYDSETGGYSPDGHVQISTSNILIAAGMAYQRTVTSGGAVWVLQCNHGTATLSGDGSGFFFVADGDGDKQFEIVKGDRLEIGADADGITMDNSTTPPTVTIPYSVVADAHPTLRITGDLAAPVWKDEDDADCIANVSWSGTSGAYVATVQRKTAGPRLFVRATYMAGGETYVRNVAPVKVEGGILCTDGVHKVRPVYNNGSVTWEVVQ